MRWMVLCAVAAASLAGSVSTPRAETNWPWCAMLYDRDGEAESCGFANVAQCEATVSGQSGRCYRNPRYQPDPPRRPNRRQHR